MIVLLLLGLGFGPLMLPYQALSELGFVLQQRLWLQQAGIPWRGALLLFAAALLLFTLAWGPLASGRGGGLTPALALQHPATAEQQRLWEGGLSLDIQLRRLPLIALTHLGGLSVGVESPSAALGAAVLLAIRRRWPRLRPLAAMPLPLLLAVGGGAGLGAAFRSPLLGIAYGLEELSRDKGLSLVLPTLLLGGSGTLVATRLGQPARLEGLQLGPLQADTMPWALLITVLAALLGSLFVRLLVGAAQTLKPLLQRRRLATATGLAVALTLLALASGGLSLNDGSLSLGPALAGRSDDPPSTLLWRGLASLLSIASGCPGGLMHDTMALGSLLIAALKPWTPLAQLSTTALAQLAAIGATALFAAANRTPILCALFVFTLQGDPLLLPALLLASAISTSLAERWRGPTWNMVQEEGFQASPAGDA